MSNKDTLSRAIAAHLIADWLFQSEWMALNKTNPTHPAGWIHAGIHIAFLRLVLPWKYAFFVGIIHFVIDLRFILQWWRKIYGQTRTGDMGVHVAIWGDQVTHIAVLWGVVELYQYFLRERGVNNE